MMARKTPTERGYHPVMLTETVHGALTRHKEAQSLSSMSSAVQSLLEALARPSKISADDLEAALNFAAVSGKSAQKLRDWFGV